MTKNGTTLRRRQICKAYLAGVAIPLSGCLGRFDGGSSNEIETAEPVTEIAFDFSDGSDENSRDDPLIEVDTDQASARITGTLRVGSGSCNEATLDEITYDGDSGTVTVVVTWVDTSDEGEVCTDDLSSDDYEVRLQFESLPSAITAVERNYRGEEYTTTAEIDAN